MAKPSERPRILVVGLNVAVRDLIANAGYATQFTSSGFEAHAFAVESPPDLVLVEPVLNDMSGTDACRLLRADSSIPKDLPILVLFEGPPTPELRVAALRVGAWDFISPSAGPEEVLLRVASHVEAHRAVAEAVEEGFLDATSGFVSQPGVARRAHVLAALMTRVTGAFACLVVELSGRSDLHGLGAIIARTVRLSDVVGDLGGSRMVVLAPGTDDSGAVRLAERIKQAVESTVQPAVSPSTGAAIAVGYDVVSNARYMPIQPYALIRRAASALQRGISVGRHDWVRRATDVWPSGPSEALGSAYPTKRLSPTT